MMFKLLNVRRPIHTQGGFIDLEINHPDYGWIPFTASPDDVEAYGRGLYEMALGGAFGLVADYEPPIPVEDVNE